MAVCTPGSQTDISFIWAQGFGCAYQLFFVGKGGRGGGGDYTHCKKKPFEN